MTHVTGLYPAILSTPSTGGAVIAIIYGLLAIAVGVLLLSATRFMQQETR